MDKRFLPPEIFGLVRQFNMVGLASTFFSFFACSYTKKNSVWKKRSFAILLLIVSRAERWGEVLSDPKERVRHFKKKYMYEKREELKIR